MDCINRDSEGYERGIILCKWAIEEKRKIGRYQVTPRRKSSSSRGFHMTWATDWCEAVSEAGLVVMGQLGGWV